MPPTEDEWTVVTRQDKRRVIRSKNRRPAPSSAAFITRNNNGENWTDSTRCEVIKTMSQCRQVLSTTNFFRGLKQSLLEKFEIQQIVCYGIGNLSTSTTASMLQLACAMALREVLMEEQDTDNKKSEIPFFFYDPCTSESEADLMTNEWNIQVMVENEQGKRNVTGLTTLFFMPHCPLALYGNVLWANWMKDLNRVVLFGNSLSLYQERAIDKTTIPQTVSLLLPVIEQVKVTVSKRDTEQVEGDLESAFNDCFLTWFVVKDDILLPPRPPEVVMQDGEVI